MAKRKNNKKKKKRSSTRSQAQSSSMARWFEKQIVQAERLEQAGKYQEALELLLPLEKKYPRHPDVLDMLISLGIEMKNLSAVVTYSQRLYPLQTGDVLMLDTGVIWDGYFSDFDRNFAAGKPTDNVGDAYAKLIDAVDAAADIAKPGQRASDLFKAMNDIVAPGSSGSDAGRLGHGLGMQLTEWPSLIRADDTVLEPGMVLTLEPGIDVGAGKLLVHEENIVIREDGAEFLSARASGNMPVLG